MRRISRSTRNSSVPKGRRRSSLALFTAFSLVFSLLAVTGFSTNSPDGQPALAASSVVAYDMVGSASDSLISFTDDPAIPFASPGDGFNKFQRGVSPSIPFAVADDSAGSFPADTLGIVKTSNTDEFFGIVDTNNDDTGGRDVVATWVFNVGGAENLSLSIDMGAMGDFEAANDFFNWSYSIDGSPAQAAFQSSVDEGMSQDYVMDGGAVVTLDDPMLVNGVLLNNNLQTQTAALTGSGSQLTLVLTANTDGGSEAIAYQNIVINGEEGAVNIAPTVSTTDPADGAEYVNVDSNIEIAFSEAVTTTDPWFEIICSGEPIPALASGGPTVWTLDPISDLPSTTACTVTVLASGVADQADPPLNMEQNYVFGFTTNAVCGDPATLVSAVQGPGNTSPIVGDVVTVEGVVVGDFQEGTELSGFFVQEENADFDGDVNTSEGVFVDERSYNGPDVNEGDLVRASGTVVENFEHTEIVADNVLACSYPAGPYGPVSVMLPETTDGDLEMVEGMHIDLTNTMSVAQNYFVGRYGQLTLSSDLTNRLFQPTNQVLPNTSESAALADYNNRQLLFLDDGVDVSSCGDNPVPVPYLGAAPPSVLRGGDQVSNLTGVLDYGTVNSGGPCSDPTSFGRDYRLHPTQAPVFSTQNPRTAAPDEVGGSVKLVSFNVLNFFNGDGVGGGFPTDRGADSFNEFVRQRIKIYEAMKAIDGDVFGLMEIENDGFGEDSAIAELAKVLNEGPCWNSPDECAALGYADPGLGAGTYAYIDAGSGAVGSDAIAVGFIYKPASVTPVGEPLVVDEPAFVDPNNTGSDRNRPAIAQTFRTNSDDAVFTPIVNHLKSKGSPCGPGDDDPEQASCNVTRALAAEYLVDTVVPAVQAASGDPDVAIVGDLNAYAMEDPVQALVSGGFTDLVKAFAGEYAYSYTFDGLVGYLDHSLANNDLFEQVTGVTAWHINTDEPAVIDYDENFNPSGYYGPDPYRASDHDPIVVGLDLTASPRKAKDHSIGVLSELLPTGNRYYDKRITKAIESIEDSLNPAYWVDDFHLTDKGNKVFDEEKKAVKDLMRVHGSIEPEVDAVIATLVMADEELAAIAIEAATAAGGNEWYLRRAEREMQRAQYDLDRGRPDKAIDHYKKAWRYAERSLRGHGLDGGR